MTSKLTTSSEKSLTVAALISVQFMQSW